MSESILTSTKKILGVGASDTSFDLDIMTHINTTFAILNDLGVGPPEGFVITGVSEEWSDYLGDADLYWQAARTYVYMKVRLAFDPPTTGFHVDALKAQIQELEWRLNTHREGKSWTNPLSVDESS